MHRLSTAAIKWRFLLRAIVAAIALASVLVGGGASASDWENQRGQLKIAPSDSSPSTLRMMWQGPIMAPMAEQIRQAFEDRKAGTTRVALAISSNGGSVAEGERVIEVLRHIKTTHELETMVARGEKCASMCVFIYVQGQKRSGALTSSWLFHEVSRRDPLTKQTTLDRSAFLRLIDKYFRPAGVSEDWIASVKERTVETDYWQTGADLVQANSGIILTPLGNQRARNLPPQPRHEEAKSTHPQAQCKRYFASIGAVLTVPCSQ